MYVYINGSLFINYSFIEETLVKKRKKGEYRFTYYFSFLGQERW